MGQIELMDWNYRETNPDGLYDNQYRSTILTSQAGPRSGEQTNRLPRVHNQRTNRPWGWSVGLMAGGWQMVRKIGWMAGKMGLRLGVGILYMNYFYLFIFTYIKNNKLIYYTNYIFLFITSFLLYFYFIFTSKFNIILTLYFYLKFAISNLFCTFEMLKE